MDFTEILKVVFAKVDNVAILILLVVFGWREWRTVQRENEEREDKKALATALDRNTDAINSLKIIVAAVTGKTS